MTTHSQTQLRIVQLNLGRGAAATADCVQKMIEDGIDAALIQEPYVRYSNIKGFPASMRVFASGNNKSCVVINDASALAMVIPQAGDELVCVYYKGRLGAMYLTSMYCVFRQPIEPFLSALKLAIDAVGGGRNLVGMDANASSRLWHSKGTLASRKRERGVLLQQVIDEKALVVINEPSAFYTFSKLNARSDIDVTLVTEEFDSEYSTTWNIEEGASTSDHSWINITVSRKVPYTSPEIEDPLTRWSAKNVDWTEYQRFLCAAEPRGDRELSADERVAEVMGLIHEANQALLKRFEVSKPKQARWWTPALRKQRGKLRSAKRRYNRARREGRCTEMDATCVRRLMAEYKYALAKAKLEDWQQFVATTGNANPWGPVYRYCLGKRSSGGLSSLRQNGVLTRTWAESADCLLQEFFPRAIPQDPRALALSEEPPIVSPDEPINRSEVEDAIRCNKNGKAPGVDGITAKMAKVCWRAMPDRVTAMFEACRVEGVFPTVWKTAHVVILLKSEGKIRSDPRSYRPISLLPVFAKTLERMMVRRLLMKVESQLSDNQFGFTRGRCTEDAFHAVQSAVAVSDRRYVLGVFVDFRGAFDNLGWNHILTKLRRVGCGEIPLWRSYFSDRKAFVAEGKETRHRDVERGCPQGSICGPFIWNFMLDDLLKELFEENCKVVAYADDLLLLIETNSRLEMERKATAMLQRVTEWGTTNGLQVNREKTVSMLLKGNLSLNRPPTIKMYDSTISYVTSVKYLGVRIGERLTFSGHFSDLREKIGAVAGKLVRVLRKEWGLNKKSTLTIYDGLLTAIAMYGSSAWLTPLNTVRGRAQLLGCQRSAMLPCLNVCRTVSTEAMQVLMGVVPWDLVAAQRSVMFRLRRSLPLRREERVTMGDLEGVAPSQIKSVVVERLADIWQDRWNTSTKGRTTFEWIPDVRFSRRHSLFHPSTALCFLLTGHGSLNKYLFGIADAHTASDQCDCGGGTEDWRHVLVECPLYAASRDLEAMAIGTGDMSLGLATQESYNALEQFAHLAFAERRARIRAAAAPEPAP